MSKKMKYSTAMAIVLGGFVFPSIVAHADGGVVTSEAVGKDASGNVKTFKPNDSVFLKRENKDVYVVELNHKEFRVAKDRILKTIKHEEESLMINREDMSVKSTPDVFGASLVQVAKGEIVTRIPDETEQMGLVKVRTSQNIEGWVLKSGLTVKYKEVPITQSAFIGDDSQQEKGLDYRDEISLVGFNEGKYMVKEGGNTIVVEPTAVTFVKPEKRVVKPAITPAVRVANVVNDRQSPAQEYTPATENGYLADNVIATGSQFLGVPYVWGGTSPRGFDCSGFTQYVLARNGISIPRVASEQATLGTSVSRDNLEKGDMVFFQTYKAGASHVGFYTGDGKFLHAGGNKVQITSLSDSYWSKHYLYAKRVF